MWGCATPFCSADPHRQLSSHVLTLLIFNQHMTANVHTYTHKHTCPLSITLEALFIDASSISLSFSPFSAPCNPPFSSPWARVYSDVLAIYLLKTVLLSLNKKRRW